MSRRIIKLGDDAELYEILRRAGTMGEASLRPYRDAQLSLETVAVADLVPLSNYLLENQIQAVEALLEQFQCEGIDILDLPGRVVWVDGEREQALAPPIVEHWEAEGLLLVDGLHRISLARRLQRRSVTCVVARGVSVPLVPLPTDWGRVRVYRGDDRPTEEQKRNYRFDDAQSLRAAIPHMADRVRDENYRYFLFRDLAELGSSGIRKTAEMPKGGVS